MKVLIVTCIAGFLPQFLMGDVRNLREMGCEIHYATNFKYPVYEFDEEKLQNEGVILHDISIRKSPVHLGENLRAFFQLFKILRREQIDLIHCHNPMGGVIGRCAAVGKKTKGRKILTIYTAHGFHFYKGAPLRNWLLYYPAEKLLARLTDICITINGEDYTRALGFRLRKNGFATQIHGVGVDESRFCPKPDLRETVRTELQIPKQAFHIVTAAELNQNKNQEVVIRAIAELHDPSVYYSICGRGPEENSLRVLIEELGLAEQVHLLGYREDMERVLQSADVFVFPSKREGLGIAAIEALLCGVPLIVADNRGTREYAIDLENALICKKNSPEYYEDAIRYLMKKDTVRERLARNARSTAERFTRTESIKSMHCIYEKAIRRGQGEER